MYSPTHLDIDRIAMRGPNPVPFDEDIPEKDLQGIRFVNPVMNRKQLKLTLVGKITEDLYLADYKNGKTEYVTKFKPRSDQLPNLERLESIFENDPLTENFVEQLNIPQETYVHKFTIGETDSQIRLKFKEDGNGGFKIDCDQDLDIKGHLNACKVGTHVEIDAAVSYYFREAQDSKEENTYGMIVRPIEIRYNPNVEITKIKPVKKKLNK